MNFFHLDTNKCKKDGICSKVCIASIIKNDENNLPYIEDGKEKLCMECGLCAAFCPNDACYVEKLDRKQFHPIDKANLPSAYQSDMLLKARRSIRNFKKTPASTETLLTILDAVRYAPTAKNSQNIRWIITKGTKETDNIRSLMLQYFEETAEVTTAPNSVFMKTLVRTYKSGRDIFLRGAPQLAISVIPKNYDWKEDASIALTYFEISAFAHGLGTCWAGFFTSAARKYLPLKEAVGIGENEYVGGALMVGNPIYEQHVIPSRKPLNLTWI